MHSSGIAGAPQPESPSGLHWTALQRWAFRVAFIYFTVDAAPDLLIRLPGGPAVLVVYWKVWNPVLAWFGHYILHVPNAANLRLPIGPVLLGDFAGGYVLMLCFLLLALAVAAVWTYADRRRRHYRTLHYWLRVYVRYALAFSMLGYGVSKLFHVQFRSLGLVDLMTPIGMLRPMELLWNFMDFSRPYQVFTGVVECLGATLLFARRTTLLGSLLLIGALSNVLMMDISYGVHVKRIALRLLLMALFLIVPDLRRLADLFLLHRPTAPADPGGPSWRSSSTRRLAIAAKVVVIVYIIITQLIRFSDERKLVAAPRPELYGLYKVQRSLRNGREVAPDSPRNWQWIAIDGHGMAVQLSSGDWDRHRADFDDAKQSITIWTGPQRKSSLTYARASADEVLLKGVLDDQPAEILLRRIPEPRFPLNDPRELRWVSIW